MMWRWEPQMIRFMRDASEYGDYHRRLAGLLLPYLRPDDRLCDAGCGLGYLSLALAPHVGSVTAVDQNADALCILRENCRGQAVSNLTAVCGDLFAAPPHTPYDAMVFCFFGRMQEILTAAAAQCRGRVFVITRNYGEHRFSVGNHPSGDNGFAGARRFLLDRAIPFEEMTAALEFGQPFRTFADAKLFFETYSVDADKSLITDAFLRGRLTETGRTDFPYYLPHRRPIGLLIFHTDPKLSGKELSE